MANALAMMLGWSVLIKNESKNALEPATMVRARLGLIYIEANRNAKANGAMRALIWAKVKTAKVTTVAVYVPMVLARAIFCDFVTGTTYQNFDKIFLG